MTIGIAATVSVICFGDLLSDIPIMAPGAYINGKSNIQLQKLPISITVSSEGCWTELSGLQQFNAFRAKLYLRAWCTCTCMSPISAPRNDLKLLKQFFAYSFANKPIAHAAMKTLMCHWLSLPICNSESRDVAALSKSGEDSSTLWANLIDEGIVTQCHYHTLIRLTLNSSLMSCKWKHTSWNKILSDWTAMNITLSLLLYFTFV